MSATTLETLRDDYEARGSDYDALADEDFTLMADDQREKWHAKCLREFAKLDALYNMIQVAEDHGLEAAMLFKLSGGNMDPRVSA